MWRLHVDTVDGVVHWWDYVCAVLLLPVLLFLLVALIPVAWLKGVLRWE